MSTQLGVPGAYPVGSVIAAPPFGVSADPTGGTGDETRHPWETSPMHEPASEAPDPMLEFTGLLDHELDRLVVVSPHFDDAVLGAGQLITHHPGTTVITVMGGKPPAYPDPPGRWDALGGFRSGDDVVAARRAEDEAATAVLGARSVWLDFSEYTYLAPADRPRPDRIARVLRDAIVEADPTAVLIPFGLGNPDHFTTHDASRIVMEELFDRCAWYCYEDSGYKHIPGLLAWRVSQLFRSGLWPTPAVLTVDPSAERKALALSEYRSQLAPLDRNHRLVERLQAGVPEQYWRLAPPPPGWEGLAES
jgi:LmbE family N-acetylglucosaminyl deacetylase